MSTHTLPSIEIHDGPIAFDEARERLGNDNRIVGYNAVWPSPTDRPEHQWKALHVSNDGGGSEWWAESRESAVALIHESIGRSRTFWLEKVRWREAGDRDDDGRQIIRVDGRHYVIGEEPSDRALRCGAAGFGGRLLTFRLLADGAVIRSRNVWTQGEIPDEFRNALPGNALPGNALPGNAEAVDAPGRAGEAP